MDLQINEVADLLSVSEKTIRRWILDGTIPTYRLDTEQPYQFNRNEIEDWLIRSKQKFERESENSDPKLRTVVSGNKQFSLYRALHRGQVISNIASTTKEGVIRETMQRVAKGMDLDAEVLIELLLDRERLHPTALNMGIGIPHTRDFLLKSPYDVVTVVYPKHPIMYGALDGQPVHTLFFLFACDDKRHLNLLAKIAHFCSQEPSLALLSKKPDKDTLLDYVKAWEGA